MRAGSVDGRRGEEGFTLVEALVAIVVLVFGLIAITNLLVVAAASNTVGNHSTATAAAASEVLERLKSRNFTDLTAGGNAEDTADDTVNGGRCDETTPPATAADECVRPDNFNMVRGIPGVGTIETVWEIRQIDTQTLFIRVRSESASALAGRRSRAEFTTFRSCTSVAIGCPS